jgi:hypothetical protein
MQKIIEQFRTTVAQKQSAQLAFIDGDSHYAVRRQAKRDFHT